MSQSESWGFRGIDQRARDAAREAARAEGITLGEYLDRLIRAADEPQPEEVRPPTGARRAPPDAASVLDRLSRRIEATEARSTLAITGIDHTVLGLVARIQNAEQTTAAVAGHVEGLIEEMRLAHETLQTKVRRLELDDAGKKNLDALKALETALGKLASHVYEEAEHAQAETEAIKGRMEAGFAELSERAESIEVRIDRTLSDAAARVEKAVQQAELRTEGAARHLSDRMSQLETQVHERLAAVGDTGERIAAIEADVSGALSSMETTLVRVQERLNRAEAVTDAALKGLEQTVSHLDARIETVARQVDPEQASRLRREFEARFEDVSRLVRAAVENARTELAGEIARTVQPGQQSMDALKDELGALRARLADIEARPVPEASGVVEEDFARLSHLVSERIEALAAHVDQRLTDSEDRNAAAIEQVGEQVTVAAVRLQKRQDEALTQMAQEIDNNRKQADVRLSDALANISERLAEIQAQSTASVSPVQRAIAQLATRLENLEACAAPPAASSPHLREAAATPAQRADVRPSYQPRSAAPASATADATPAAAQRDDIELSPIPMDTDDFEAGIETWEVVSAPPESPYQADFDAIRRAADRVAAPRPQAPPAEAAAAPAGSMFAKPAAADDGRLFDPVSELDGLEDAGTEARESDIFDSETDETARRGPAPPNAASPRASENAETRDYLARARQAALAASEQKAKGRGQPAKGSPASPKAATRPSGPSRTPIVIAASAVVLSGAGAGGYLYLRGKQPNVIDLAGALRAQPLVAGVETARQAPPATETVASAPEYAMGALAPQPFAVPDVPTPDEDLFADRASAATDEIFEEDRLALAVIREAAGKAAAPATDTPAPATPVIASLQPVTSGFPPIPVLASIETEAAAGNAVAQFQLAQRKRAEGDADSAATLLRRAAQKGLAPAQYELGKMYERGEGVVTGPAEARALIAAAAEAGHVNAMYDFAIFLTSGEGGPRDEALAIEWFRRAASHGSVDAMYNLGVIFAEGIGTTQNLAESLFWFELAAQRGDAGAETELPGLKARVDMGTAIAAAERANRWRPAEPSALANGKFGPQRWTPGNPLQVKAVQTALQALGYLQGAADGVSGRETARAIRAYQSAESLEVTGNITPALVESLNAKASPPRS